jgi:hypothetical protein
MEPWARFNTFKVPKIIDRPAAIRNRTIPTLIPLRVCPAIASNVTRFVLSFETPGEVNYLPSVFVKISRLKLYAGRIKNVPEGFTLLEIMRRWDF